MRKLVFTVVIILIMATYTASASFTYASGPFTSGAFDGCFHPYLQEAYSHLLHCWDENEHYYNDGSFLLTKTTSLDGHPYTIEICGINDRVDTVCFIGWFDDMKGYEETNYGLEAYDACLFSCEDYIPDVDELGDDITVVSCFAPGRLYGNVSAGSSYRSLGSHWEIISTPPGRLAARHSDGCMIEAQRMGNGALWFTITF